MPDSPTQARQAGGGDVVESTAELLTRVRAGDAPARERLVSRFLPALSRWAHGRLPSRARGMVDTNDLVQDSLLRALDKVEQFEPRREGAFLSYLRSILMNQIRDEIRRVERRPAREPLGEHHPEKSPSPLELAIGAEVLERYETALARLPEDQREAVILRVELGLSHQEVADATGRPSANAARMFAARALVQLAEAMGE